MNSVSRRTQVESLALVLGVAALYGSGFLRSAWGGQRPDAVPRAPARSPAITYRLTCPSPNAKELDILLTAQGLHATPGDIELVLSDFGEWSQVDALYLRDFTCSLPARRHPQRPDRFLLTRPARWNGALRVRYRIPIADFDSVFHERHGLLPWVVRDAKRRPLYAFLFTENTLMQIRIGEQTLRGNASLTVVPPRGMPVTSGWAGLTRGPQTVQLREGVDQTPVIFGEPIDVTTQSNTFKSYQFSRARKIGPEVAALLGPLSKSYAAAVGVPAPSLLRVFITDKGGGQRTSHGLLIGHSVSSGEYYKSNDFKRLVAHELFHSWLGGLAHSEDSSTEFFKEGFTDYIALRHLAQNSLIDRDWFAEYLDMVNTMARSSESFGKVAFADPNVAWRDGNGPNETLIYRAGAVLAFATDVELRASNAGGVETLVGDIIRQGGRYTQATLRDLYTRHGLGALEEAYIRRAALPELPALLAHAGFSRTKRDPAMLTYTGIQTDKDTYLGAIKAIDPDGPASKLPIQVGDEIDGLFPARGERPQVGAAVTTPYRFGLDLCAEDAEEVTIGFVRNGEKKQVKLRPRRIPGGERLRYTGASAPADAFFRANPAKR
jgi:hypothetical protein